MYWVSYYLQRGHNLEYLLKISELEKIFFIKSMERTMEDKVRYDSQKIEVLLKALGGE